MHRRALFRGLAAIGLGVPFVRPSFGQTYPSRPIRIVVPTPAGAPPDILARIVGNDDRGGGGLDGGGREQARRGHDDRRRRGA